MEKRTQLTQQEGFRPFGSLGELSRAGKSRREMTGFRISVPSVHSPLNSACPKLCSGENMDNQRKSTLDKDRDELVDGRR
jgi:hypothetical protein